MEAIPSELEGPSELCDGLSLEAAKLFIYAVITLVEDHVHVPSRLEYVAQAIVQAELFGLIVILDYAVKGQARTGGDADS